VCMSVCVKERGCIVLHLTALIILVSSLINANNPVNPNNSNNHNNHDNPNSPIL
jgi:hypothetical protein